MNPIKIVLFASIASAWSVAAVAGPIHLLTPTGYDNVGDNSYYGQTFLAEEPEFYGIKLYIGDPDRLDQDGVDELEGPAELVLWDATDLGIPIEVARETVVDLGDTIFGLHAFVFSAPVATVVGTRYLASVDSADGFGVGLVSLHGSTFDDGNQARYRTIEGDITEAGNGRDLSFEILTAPVPEPTTMLMLLTALPLLRRFRFRTTSRR